MPVTGRRGGGRRAARPGPGPAGRRRPSRRAAGPSAEGRPEPGGDPGTSSQGRKGDCGPAGPAPAAAPAAGPAAGPAHPLGGGAVPARPRLSQRRARPCPLPGAARRRAQPAAGGKALQRRGEPGAAGLGPAPRFRGGAGVQPRGGRAHPAREKHSVPPARGRRAADARPRSIRPGAPTRRSGPRRRAQGCPRGCRIRPGKSFPAPHVPRCHGPSPAPRSPEPRAERERCGLRGPAAPQTPRSSRGGCSRRANGFDRTGTGWSSRSERFKDTLASPNSITSC